MNPQNRRRLLKGLATVAFGPGLLAGGTLSAAQPGPSKRSVRYEELSASELAARLKETSIVYFPLGTVEFHGPHLPLGMDAMHIHEFYLRAAERTGGVVLPPTYWSPAGHTGWTGSLLISDETSRALVLDVLGLLAKQEVRLVVVGSGHFPTRQEPLLAKFAKELMKEYPKTRVLVLGPWTAHPTDPQADHAGKKETSLMMLLHPEFVHLERLKRPEDFKGIARNAVDGSREYGREYFQASLENFIKRVQEALAQLPP